MDKFRPLVWAVGRGYPNFAHLLFNFRRFCIVIVIVPTVIQLSFLHLMLAVALLLILVSCSKGTIFPNNVTFGFLFCLIKRENRSDACSNYSVRAHKTLFCFLSDDFLKELLFQLSYTFFLFLTTKFNSFID